MEQPADWTVDEMQGLALGDERLNRRAREALSKLGKHPSGSIPHGCDEWADTKATYELFKNENVTAAKLLQPHQERTWQRVGHHPCVLAVQDTTYLDYSHYPSIEGLGPIGTEDQNLHGIIMHNTLAITPTGVPLGTLHQQLWVRTEREAAQTQEEKRGRPIEEKESYKWIESLKALTPHIPASTHLIAVCDAESDVYELLHEAQQCKASFLIRAAQDRALLEPEEKNLWAAVLKQKSKAQLTIEVAAKKQEPARKATVSVRYRRVKLKPPYRSKKQRLTPLKPVTVTAILVREDNPPAKITPVEWLLLTNVGVTSIEDALECIEWYCQRWQVEIFHKVLKSGCRIEHRRLKNFDRLQPCIALFSVIAWRIHWMTWLLRAQPDAPCTLILADSEWRALYTLATRTVADPDKIPSVEQAILWIAQLGGFLRRKSDGVPGVTVIWRGWQRFQDALSMWLILDPLIDMGKT